MYYGWPSLGKADVDVHNNHYQRQIIPSRIEAYKKKKSTKKVSRYIMQDIKTELKKDEKKLKVTMNNSNHFIFMLVWGLLFACK